MLQICFGEKGTQILRLSMTKGNLNVIIPRARRSPTTLGLKVHRRLCQH